MKFRKNYTVKVGENFGHTGLVQKTHMSLSYERTRGRRGITYSFLINALGGGQSSTPHSGSFIVWE